MAMVGPVPLALATVMERARTQAQAKQLENNDNGAFAGELQTLTATPAPIASSAVERQAVVSLTETCQLPVHTMSATDTGVSANPAVAAEDSVFALENPIAKVQEALRSIGIEPSGMKFELLDDVATGPGGTRVNHYMRVQLPGGWEEDFGVEMVNRTPMVTAYEIASLVRRGVAPASVSYQSEGHWNWA
ncbi:MAG: hypothetical protein IT162_05240 [Bryobacterales bacterium]|nr:hypothetical protein [Bryobacterales bacterium]